MAKCPEPIRHPSVVWMPGWIAALFLLTCGVIAILMQLATQASVYLVGCAVIVTMRNIAAFIIKEIRRG